MRKEIFKEIEIPNEVETTLDGNTVRAKGKKWGDSREFNLGKIKMEKIGNKIKIGRSGATKKEKRMINTFATHIKNMIHGVNKGYEYKLKVVFSHFPITVELHGKEAIIKNFLGEKVPRKMKIPNGAEVEVDKENIKVSSYNKEIAGQTAANFEKATRITLRDRRVFQDGIFITSKPGGES